MRYSILRFAVVTLASLSLLGLAACASEDGPHSSDHEHHHGMDGHASEHEHHHGDDGHADEHEHHQGEDAADHHHHEDETTALGLTTTTPPLLFTFDKDVETTTPPLVG